MSISVPNIGKHIQIGALSDGTSITFEDLTFMTTYVSPYVFSIHDKSTPKASGMQTVTDVVITSDGWKEINPRRGVIKGTVGSVEMDKIVVDFFNDNVWEENKVSFPEQDKWKLFGYFMTNHAQKCLGSTAWNYDSLVYWSRVAETLKC